MCGGGRTSGATGPPATCSWLPTAGWPTSCSGHAPRPASEPHPCCGPLPLPPCIIPAPRAPCCSTSKGGGGLGMQEVQGLFPVIEDYMWFQLALVRSAPPEAASGDVAAAAGLQPATLEGLQLYLQQYPPAHYSQQGAHSVQVVIAALLCCSSQPSSLCC